MSKVKPKQDWLIGEIKVNSSHFRALFEDLIAPEAVLVSKVLCFSFEVFTTFTFTQG
jgi:hypothetical protein